MAKYRHGLPQLSGKLFLTDGGIETTLVFLEGLELPSFAAFVLLEDEKGMAALRRYYARHAEIAKSNGTGFILESPTWRSSADWGAKLGYSADQLATLNRKAIALMAGMRAELETSNSPMVVSGCIGPRGDGYVPGKLMTGREAMGFHAAQVRAFADGEADMITAITMNYVEEGIGVAAAAKAASVPSAISFTVETDGKLPSGQPLGEAIAAVDAATNRAPAYYMINCAHPTHFEDVLAKGEPWVERLRGIRANASKRSHAELDAATDLDDGDPVELGRQYAALRARFGWINVLGGCCGTDHRHVEEICRSCQPLAA
ncbi:MAG: homocysteine S-methyltransferase family protein [Alphaproteobacteria bacterium]